MNKHNIYNQKPKSAKFWDNEDHIIGKTGLFRRINEDQWFRMEQDLLLWMANTKYGRDLLCISKNFPKIIEISKKHITGVVDVKKVGNQYIVTKKSEFRVGAKYANIIRYRWQEFQEYAYEYYRQKNPIFMKLPVLFPVVPHGSFAYTVSTFYPDPDPETATVDGTVSYDSAPTTNAWATIRDADPGLGADPTTNQPDPCIGISDRTGLQAWQWFYRTTTLFDTSSIPDADNIDSATWSLDGAGTSRTTLADSVVMVNTAPASNTNLVAADYASPEHGNTLQSATEITVANWSTSAYNVFTLNATGLGNISKTGISKFGGKIKSDQANTEPGTAGARQDASVVCNFAEATGTTEDPKLEVTHSSATTSAAFLLNFM